MQEEMTKALRPRILCVDDQLSVVELLAAMLGFSGQYAVDIETDSYAVISRALQSRPDLIILDIKMPGIDGLEVARGLRRESGLCHTPIIFFSGVPELRDWALKAAGNERAFFFLKGSPMTEMESLVGSVLSERLQVLRDSLPTWARRQGPFAYS